MLRVKRAIGGPMTGPMMPMGNRGIGPPQGGGGYNPQMIQMMLARLRAGAGSPGALGGMQGGAPMSGAPGGMPPMPSIPGGGNMMGGGAGPTPNGMPRPGVMPPMPMNQPSPVTPGGMGGALGAMGGPRPMQPPPMSGMPMQPQPMQPNLQNMRPMMSGGGIVPPGMHPGSPLPPMKPVGGLASLIGQKMAGQHAGFPGPRKPRIPMPGQLRNINQTINRPREALKPV